MDKLNKTPEKQEAIRLSQMFLGIAAAGHYYFTHRSSLPSLGVAKLKDLLKEAYEEYPDTLARAQSYREKVLTCGGSQVALQECDKNIARLKQGIAPVNGYFFQEGEARHDAQ